MDTFIQDVRFGMRQIGRSRLHAVAVVLTLALGIGLNTGIFSVLKGMLLRPRVTTEPASFVHLATRVIEKYGEKNEARDSDWPFSAADYQTYRASAQSVNTLAAW